MINFLDLTNLNLQYKQQFKDKLDKVLESGMLVLGNEVAEFEAELAKYCGVTQCAGVANGLDAISLALLAAGVKPGDNVVVPAHTFIATWLAARAVGANIVPIDIDETGGIDVNALKSLNDRIKAVIPVHLYGHPCEMDEINAWAKQKGAVVIEDAAQAHGALYKGRKCGSLGTAAAFSFYPGKNLGCLGDGGAVVSHSLPLVANVKLRRNYGSIVKYVHEEIGINSRLDELQAAFLRLKLIDLDQHNHARKNIVRQYQQDLQAQQTKLGFVLPKVRADADPCWHIFQIRIQGTGRRNLCQKVLLEKGIQTLIHYPIPPHKQKAFTDYAHMVFPLAEAYAMETLSLPLSPTQTEEETLFVIRSILDTLATI